MVNLYPSIKYIKFNKIKKFSNDILLKIKSILLNFICLTVCTIVAFFPTLLLIFLYDFFEPTTFITKIITVFGGIYLFGGIQIILIILYIYLLLFYFTD